MIDKEIKTSKIFQPKNWRELEIMNLAYCWGLSIFTDPTKSHEEQFEEIMSQLRDHTDYFGNYKRPND